MCFPSCKGEILNLRLNRCLTLVPGEVGAGAPRCLGLQKPFDRLLGKRRDWFALYALELLVSFVLSFVIVSLLTLVGWFLWLRIKKR